MGVYTQAHSQGVQCTPPNLPKGPLTATKWAKNVFVFFLLIFCSGVKGVRFKKSTFWVQNVHYFGVPHHPKIDPGYGPVYTLVNKFQLFSKKHPYRPTRI